MTSPSHPDSEHQSLPPAEPGDDRDSITEVRGTVARFEMSYSLSPTDRLTFGPPLRFRIPSFIYLALALVALALVFIAYASPSNSRLYVWLVEGDKNRPLSSIAFALILVASAVGTVIRAHMRGVVVRRDGLEARYLMAMGIPRIRQWSWAQISRLILDEKHVMLELWDNHYERLPEVAAPAELGELLERLGAAHGIQITRLSASKPAH
ncbi:hypothetical protein LVJ94_49350 [Pendulispora rubella]|uniref:PH domain-containing protein n=1 Tax=Pendulispora rubella TaxID=2741070 RepID=A0ABZ2L6N7_9BACT